MKVPASKLKVKVQAFRRLVSQLALLLGPLWAPATLNNPMLMLAVPLGCSLEQINTYFEFLTWNRNTVFFQTQFPGVLLLGAILFMASWRWMRVEVEVEEMETAL